MRKRILVFITTILFMLSLCGCGTRESNVPKIALDDGKYLVNFDTDSTMFHVNEMMDGKALLTVSEGRGNLHLIMPSKNVINLYLGVASDAESDADNLINPVVEDVTYDDGFTEEVFAFDVPVSVIDEEFDLALIGKKNVWYDHKVIISDPQSVDDSQSVEDPQSVDDQQSVDGTQPVVEQTIEVTLDGGTGKTTLTSPTKIVKTDDGYLLTVEWSSKHYDYMIVDDVTYNPVSVGETSIYEIPVKDISVPLNVIADTVAMSEPHEIEYTITLLEDTLK